MKSCLVLCTTDSMIWNFLIPHIKKLEEKGIRVECACSKTGFYFDELLNKYELKIYELPFHRSPYSFENLRALKLLKKLIKKRKYDTIWCHEPVGGAMGRIAGHACGVRVVYMAHGFHFYKGAPKKDWLIYYNVEKILSKYTDLLITINQEDYEAAKKFSAKKVALVNGIGVDLNKFHRYESNYLREKFNLSDDSLILLSVGELIPRKNHKTIIQTLAELRNSKVHLFIAGDGEENRELRNLSFRLGLKNQVHFLGFCKNVSDLYNSCDIFIFPSVQEGLSMALMEAMACGKPVIASRIRGNVDLIDDKGGILVETYDVNGYVKAIRKIITHREKMYVWGENNRKKVKRYSIQSVQTQLEKLIL